MDRRPPLAPQLTSFLKARLPIPPAHQFESAPPEYVSLGERSRAAFSRTRSSCYMPLTNNYSPSIVGATRTPAPRFDHGLSIGEHLNRLRTVGKWSPQAKKILRKATEYNRKSAVQCHHLLLRISERHYSGIVGISAAGEEILLLEAEHRSLPQA